MKRTIEALFCGALFAGLLQAPALALGPVDGEIGAVWWAHDLDTEVGAQNSSDDADAPGYHAELWLFKKYGARAQWFESDPDGSAETADYTSVDLLWKAFAPTENNYFAVGVGWEDADLAGHETTGARLSIEGGIGILAALRAYGHASYLPALDDFDRAGGLRFDDVDGYEYELGIAWKVLPFLNVRAGYRATSIDFTQVDTQSAVETDGTIEAKGFLAGVGVRF